MQGVESFTGCTDQLISLNALKKYEDSRNKDVENTRRKIVDLLDNSSKQIHINESIKKLLCLPPPPPPSFTINCATSSTNNKRQYNFDYDDNELKTDMRYQEDLTDLKAAESLFQKENDSFVENSLKL